MGEGEGGGGGQYETGRVVVDVEVVMDVTVLGSNVTNSVVVRGC